MSHKHPRRVMHMQIWDYAKEAFVPNWKLGGANYVRTHRCVFTTPCSACGAEVNEACWGTTGQRYTGNVCPVRKDVFFKRITQELADEGYKVIRRARIQVRKGLDKIEAAKKPRVLKKTKKTKKTA